MSEPKMKTFEVTLAHIVRTESILKIEAASEKEANKIAEKLTQGDWSDIGNDYEVIAEDTVEDDIEIEMIDDVTPHSAYS